LGKGAATNTAVTTRHRVGVAPPDDRLRRVAQYSAKVIIT
jgi:hypothetical protein